MKNQLIPPPDLAPPSIKHLSTDEKVRLWAQTVEEGDRVLLEGLKRKAGPDGDLQKVIQDWLDRRSAERDNVRARMAAELRRRREQVRGE